MLHLLEIQLQPARGVIAGTASATATGSAVFDWAQIELNVGTGDVSSPIGPTTTGSVTRNAETATVDVSSLTLSPFSVYANYVCGTTEDGTVVEVDDGTADERVLLSSRPATGNTGLNVVDGGVSQVAITTDPDPVFGTAYKVAARLQTNLFALYTAAASGTDTTGTMPTITTLRFGDIHDGTLKLNGWIREFRLWTYALDNARLSSLVS